MHPAYGGQQNCFLIHWTYSLTLVGHSFTTTPIEHGIRAGTGLCIDSDNGKRLKGESKQIKCDSVDKPIDKLIDALRKPVNGRLNCHRDKGSNMSEDGLIEGDDGNKRCAWHDNKGDYQRYHDNEWGRPMADDTRLFEKICLEGFQSAFPG